MEKVPSCRRSADRCPALIARWMEAFEVEDLLAASSMEMPTVVPPGSKSLQRLTETFRSGSQGGPEGPFFPLVAGLAGSRRPRPARYRRGRGAAGHHLALSLGRVPEGRP